MFDDEIFYPVPGAEESIEVRKDGVFRSPLTHKPLKVFHLKKHNIWQVGTGKKRRAIVAYATVFIPNPHNLPHVHAKDGDETNCSIDNLYWSDEKYYNGAVSDSKPIRLSYEEVLERQKARIK